MTIILADLSKYDPDEVADDYAGVILNIEDPGLLNKAEIAHSAGKVIFLYSWVYAGDNGHSLSRGYAAEDLLSFHGIPVTGHLTWLDYEEAGVSINDLRNVQQWVQPERIPAVYTYLYMLNAQPGLRDVIAEIGVLWIAYYPGGAEYGDWMSETARRNGAVMHQYTSSDGHRDLNAVLDEGWYYGLINSHPAPSGPEDHRREVDMVIYHNVEVKDSDVNTPTGEWCATFGSDGPTKISAAAAYGHALAGVPWVDKQTTFGIISIAATLAQSRRDAAFWDERTKPAPA